MLIFYQYVAEHRNWWNIDDSAQAEKQQASSLRDKNVHEQQTTTLLGTKNKLGIVDTH